jgi:hypothetical protein
MWPFKRKTAMSQAVAELRECRLIASKVLNLTLQRSENNPRTLNWLKGHENDIMEVENLPGGGFKFWFPEK